MSMDQRDIDRLGRQIAMAAKANQPTPQSRNGETNAGNWMRLPHPNSKVLSHRLLNAIRLYELSKSTESLLGMLKQAAKEVAELEAAVSEKQPTEGEKAIAVDSLRWMALWMNVDSHDIAAVVMGSQTASSRRRGFERLTDPYLPEELRSKR